MNDKRCFRWKAPMKNYFQHLLNLKYHDNPSAPPQKKTRQNQNDKQLIKHTNERQKCY